MIAPQSASISIFPLNNPNQLHRAVRNHRAGRVDGRRAHILQDRDVLRRDDAANNDGDVGAAHFGELFLELGHQGEVTGGER